ncbi:Hypothetical predicted protein [Pelobates cultripes]|uniref:Uncharacterized protein n=1 Tax=Pelobates cultripes TaxID=61616 RepID=A0AAD1W4G0_PELCU|nr:Hypothetical predicted protein [Pelobates cultripes]
MAIEGANEHGVTDKIPAKTGLQGKKVKAEETVEPLVMIPVHPLSSINKTKDQNPTGQKYFSHPVTEPNYNSSSSPSSISGMSNMKQNAEQPSCSSHLFSLNTHVSTPVVPTQERHAVSSITANMNIAPVTEVPITGRVTDTQETSSTINSNKPPLESPSSSNATGKTSNTLTPDILKLLKGKDIDSVITCLKALAPFYPALQDVNIEMFAQVLANVGALE